MCTLTRSPGKSVKETLTVSEEEQRRRSAAGHRRCTSLEGTAEQAPKSCDLGARQWKRLFLSFKSVYHKVYILSLIANKLIKLSENVRCSIVCWELCHPPRCGLKSWELVLSGFKCFTEVCLLHHSGTVFAWNTLHYFASHEEHCLCQSTLRKIFSLKTLTHMHHAMLHLRIQFRGCSLSCGSP